MSRAGSKWSGPRIVIPAAAAALGIAAVGGPAFAGGGAVGPRFPPGPQVQLPTTLEDFFQPGTQPNHVSLDSGLPLQPIISSLSCSFCHAEYLEDPDSYDEPWDGWTTSMMAQSARDPVWHAAISVAGQDANLAGEYCIRCHAPGAWLAGRSVSGDLSRFVDLGFINDYDGVTCHFCHRVVDPVYQPGVSPPEDESILADLMFPPGDGRGNARYVVDPSDVRRGPFDDVPENLHGVPIIYSPFHRSSELCGTCHDVGNPVFLREPDGSYVVSDPAAGHGIGLPHGTQNPEDMFPEQRTYSEWLNSQFATDGVYFPDGRFGGNHPTGVMKICQDCHMPDVFTGGCFAWEYPPFFPRPDMPQHTFAGANTWVLRALRALYDDGFTNLSAASVAAAEDRTAAMLRAASDMDVHREGDRVRVRVTNYSGHKLPTGYPEGRRMWINVRFYDEQGELVAERGAYDLATAELDESDTKVYEMRVGIGPDVAAATSLPAGPSNRLVLVNQVLKDNRIPPIGFTNAAYAAFGGAPVGARYDDGQHWDDTRYDIPDGAASAVATLYYQSMTRAYVEFLRDANRTNHAGQVLYDLWADPQVGNMAPPIDMDTVTIDLDAPVAGDVTGDGTVDELDLLAVIESWGPCPAGEPCPADLNGDLDVGFADLLAVLANWG